jgi:hypothetical protein
MYSDTRILSRRLHAKPRAVDLVPIFPGDALWRRADEFKDPIDRNAAAISGSADPESHNACHRTRARDTRSRMRIGRLADSPFGIHCRHDFITSKLIRRFWLGKNKHIEGVAG